jgi:hypothetical protein
MVALTFCELLAMRYADWHSDTANAGLMGTSYGISVIMIGLGMLSGGVAYCARAPGVDGGGGRPPGHRDCHLRGGDTRHVRRLCHRAAGDRFPGSCRLAAQRCGEPRR